MTLGIDIQDLASQIWIEAFDQIQIKQAQQQQAMPGLLEQLNGEMELLHVGKLKIQGWAIFDGPVDIALEHPVYEFKLAFGRSQVGRRLIGPHEKA